MALFGDGFTGTPDVGFGLSDTTREFRMGWRLNSAMKDDDGGVEISLDAEAKHRIGVGILAGDIDDIPLVEFIAGVPWRGRMGCPAPRVNHRM